MRNLPTPLPKTRGSMLACDSLSIAGDLSLIVPDYVPPLVVERGSAILSLSACSAATCSST